jgi:transcription antitermination factor NusG
MRAATMNPDASLEWYELHVRSRHEKRVTERISAQSMETFLPLYRSRNTWKNGVHAEIDKPLFPRYLFAKVSARDRLQLLQLPGVLGFVASSSRPAVIADEDIAVLQRVTGSMEAEVRPISQYWRRSTCCGEAPRRYSRNPYSTQARVSCGAFNRGHYEI